MRHETHTHMRRDEVFAAAQEQAANRAAAVTSDESAPAAGTESA